MKKQAVLALFVSMAISGISIAQAEVIDFQCSGIKTVSNFWGMQSSSISPLRISLNTSVPNGIGAFIPEFDGMLSLSSNPQAQEVNVSLSGQHGGNNPGDLKISARSNVTLNIAAAQRSFKISAISHRSYVQLPDAGESVYFKVSCQRLPNVIQFRE